MIESHTDGLLAAGAFITAVTSRERVPQDTLLWKGKLWSFFLLFWPRLSMAKDESSKYAQKIQEWLNIYPYIKTWFSSSQNG